jgi:hypothetical protein
MAQAFELGKNLSVGHFGANLINNMTCILEYLIQRNRFVSWEKLVEERFVFLSVLRLFGFLMAFSDG